MTDETKSPSKTVELDLIFTKEKETKNKVRYQETESEVHEIIVGTLYVSKKAIKELGEPDKINMIIGPE